MDAMGEFSELSLRRCLANSSMLSSDVNAAYDPLFANAFEKNNASYFGRGVVFSKFTGSRGKSGSNDANAEYIARIRKMMDKMRSASRRQNLERSMSVVAERLPTSCHCMAWK